MPSRSILLATLLLSAACVGYRTPLDDLTHVDAGIPCRPGGVSLAHAQPTVMFVLDRSTSMGTAMASGRNGQTRWAALASALGSVLPSVNQAMAIGALFFPSSTSGTMNCSVAGRADLVPATGNVAALTRLMSSLAPGGATPTAAAIDTAASLLAAVRAAAGARALVLATDGGPDCNQSLDTRTCRCVTATAGACTSSVACVDDTRTVATLARHQAQGLPTYVVGIESTGDTQLSDVLDAMAVAGGRPRTGAAQSYYRATSAAELDAALATIRDQVGACTFLTGSVPDSGGAIVISLDGADLTSEEWAWGNRETGELLLLGDACAVVAAVPDTKVSAVVTCNEG